jgi:hypothetical protein
MYSLITLKAILFVMSGTAMRAACDYFACNSRERTALAKQTEGTPVRTFFRIFLAVLIAATICVDLSNPGKTAT